ncbi:vacuolar protein sorting-associated protein 52 homolog isoform X1 [Zerene cesonia]|uniref:vacuolar protein sorting-associated protein 52 homolog isoform X1 n=2 Tax=Zerene cesonia TaxID=33412 RepID=UPI0018E50798|nr:vacuolar protein sorting-associated protein 52 homolog isoform X1 [Zerene cesonia]XP_038221265.1 vacuolar protein sorting-associated protein 52 homolog isoform X1 [Zerene cesonia]
MMKCDCCDEIDLQDLTRLAGMGKTSDMSEILDKNLEDIEIQEVLKNGTDLREYALQIDKSIKEAEKASVGDYLKESENIISLHNQIEECDGILERMENMLLVFQNDLGSISNEIISLQKRSVNMSIQLSNRQALKGPLSTFIEDIAVSETLIFGINNVPVTDKEFMVQLAILNQKLNFVKDQDFKETKACHDVKDVLEKLKIKALAKIRTYILEQIYKFRKPMANYQMPQNAMLKYKFFFEFVLANERNVAQEICNEYIDTLSKVYYSYFKSYASRLDKLKYEEVPTKDDLMAIEDGSKGGFFQKSNLKNKSTIFTIGNRGDVLAQQLEAPIIVPHVQQKTKYSYEALFRSLQYALVDNSCREYLFTTEFFHVKGSHAQELFDRILGKTLSLLVKNVENYVLECYDCLALFLCIQLINRYRWMCHKRAVAALDSYWDSLLGSFWPRLEYVLKLNIQSVRECDPAKLANKELGPHYITRRYAEFSAAMLSLSEQFPSQELSNLLLVLQDEVHCFLLKMAAEFPQRIQQLIFLINNYDMVLSILMERTRDNTKEAESFREQLQARSSEYVEEILSPHFGGMMQFVKEGEQLLDSDKKNELANLEKKSLTLVASFSSNWKQSLEEIHREVLVSFPNLVTGSGLLQMALTNFVQYYHKFNKLLTPNARTQLVNIHVIMVEIKKYKTNF